MTPLELGELPALQENVAVLGYPIGGEEGCFRGLSDMVPQALDGLALRIAASGAG